MSDLIKRMKFTLGNNVIGGGDSFERSVAERQFKEAADRIEQLEASNAELRAVIELLADAEEYFSIPNGKQSMTDRWKDELNARIEYARKALNPDSED